MKEHTKAYMAGLMDAEGCFTIADNKTKLGNSHYEPCLALTGNSHDLAKWLVNNFGGSCLWKKVYITNTKPWFQWKITSYPHALKFLSLIKPYLIIKKAEAEILEDFYGLYRQIVPNIRAALCKSIKSLKNRESVTTETPTLLWSKNLVNAYFAGFFDGEGSTGVYSTHTNNPRARATLTNTFEPILHAMKKRYGGAIYSRGKRQPQHQATWSWQLDKQKQHELFLLQMLPYLVIKRDDAKKSLNWIRSRKIQSGLVGNGESVLAETQAT